MSDLEVRVLRMCGKQVVALTCDRTTTPQQLRERIEANGGPPAACQQLLCGAIALSDPLAPIAQAAGIPETETMVIITMVQGAPRYRCWRLLNNRDNAGADG